MSPVGPEDQNSQPSADLLGAEPSARAFARDLVCGMALPAALIGRDGRIRTANDALARLVRDSCEALTGRPVPLLHVGDTETGLRRPEGVIADGDIPYQGDGLACQADGATLDVMVSLGALPGLPDSYLLTMTDITDSKCLACRIRISRDRYREAFDQQTELVCRFLPDTTITFVNTAYAEALGQPAHTLIGSRLTDLLTPTDAACFRTYLTTFTADDPVRDGEESFELPGAGVTSQWWRRRAIFDVSGDVVGFQSVGRDVSVEKRRERERARLERIVLQSPVVCLAWSEEKGWPLSFASDNVRRWGYDADTLCDGGAELIRLIHPEDRPLLETLMAAPAVDGAVAAMQVRILDARGKARWMDVHLRRDADPGIGHAAAAGWEGLFTDITAERAAALRYGALFGTRAAGVMEVDLRPLRSRAPHTMPTDPEAVLRLISVKSVNERTRQVVAIPSGRVSVTLADLVTEEDRAVVASAVCRLLLGQVTHMTAEARFRRRGGGPGPWMLLSCIMPADMDPEATEAEAARAPLVAPVILLDIDELVTKRAEQKQADDRARQAERIAGLGWWEWKRGPRGGQLSCSSNLLSLIGLPPGAQLHAAELLDLIVPDERPAMRRTLTRCFRRRSDLQANCQVRGRDGATRYLRSLGEAVRDQDGRLVGLRGVSQDVTSLVETADALVATETKYRGVLENAADAVYIHDMDGTIIDANQQAVVDTGYSKAELRQLRVFGLAPTRERGFRQGVWNQLAPGQTRTLEDMHRRKDGSEFPVEVRLGAFFEGGEKRLVAIARNVSERVRVEKELRQTVERFKTYFDLGLIGMAVLSPERRWQQVNAALSTMMGRSETDMAETTWQGLLHPEDRARDIRLFRQLLAGDTDSYSAELRFLRRDGTEMPASVSVGVVRGPGGVVDHFIALVQDISERRAWETVKAENEARLRSLINGTTDVIALVDADGTIRIINRPGARLLGSTVRQSVGRSFYSFLDRREGLERRHAFKDVMATMLPLNREERWGERWLDVVIFPVVDSEGCSMGVTIHARDITARRRTEMALKDSEARLRGAFDGAVHGIALIAPDGDILQANTALAGILGRPAQELAAADHGVLRHPDDAGTSDVVDHMMTGFCEQAEAERRIRLPDGRVGWIHIAGSLVRTDDGAPLYFVVHVQDITQRREAELRARTAEGHLLESAEMMSEGLLLFDSRGRLVLANTAYRQTMPELAHMLEPGMQFEDFVRATVETGCIRQAVDDPQGWLDWRIRSFGTLTDPFEIEDQHGRWYLVRESRTVSGYTLILRADITALKTREAMLAEAKETAELANHAKSEFLANMSHELRTPLNAIIGFSDVIKNEMFGAIPNPVYVDYARNINESGTHLLEIISDILDLSKIEAGELSLEESRVDLAEVVQASILMIQPRAAAKHIALTNSIPDTLPRVRGDSLRLKQVLLNLLSNAIKYTDDGGRVTVEAAMEPTGDLALTVRDNGIGMDEDGIRVAMTAFGQVESAYTRRQGGTGLGLPLTRKLVEAHGGALRIESALGKGTAVTILLPADRCTPVPEPA